MHTVTDDILDADFDAVVPAGSIISTEQVVGLYQFGIDRVQLDGQWYLIGLRPE